MEAHAFNMLDYIVFAIILMSGLLAIFSGFVREMFSLFNWTASAYLGAHFHGYAEPLVKNYISNETTVRYASIFVGFCVSFIILGLVGAGINHFLIRGKALTAIDRSLGFVFGILRGVFMVCIIYLVLTMFLWPDIDKPATAAESPKPQAEASSALTPINPKLPPKTPPPAWVTNARTRPLISKGAKLIAEFVPMDALEKTTSEYMEKGKSFENKIDDAVMSKEDRDLYDQVQKNDKSGGNEK